jgi:hypothetical protein
MICMGHVFTGCLRELKNTMFCIIGIGCCPFLKCLEGKKIVMYIFSSILVFSIFDLFIILQKNLERLYERIQRLVIL